MRIVRHFALLYAKSLKDLLDRQSSWRKQFYSEIQYRAEILTYPGHFPSMANGTTMPLFVEQFTKTSFISTNLL